MSAPEPSSERPSDVAVVVVAAGSGRRMGADQNKLLLPLGGEPILRHTLRALGRCREIDEIILVTRPDERAQMLAIAAGSGPLPPILPADGGRERSDSVARGVACASETVTVILVHDAARPFIGQRMLRTLIDRARRDGAAIPALPVVDTLKRAEGERIEETVSREGLYAAQTPQAFRAEVLRSALALPADPDSPPPTDDAALVERTGQPTYIVPGDPMNLKLTRRSDLPLAEAYLAAFDPELGGSPIGADE